MRTKNALKNVIISLGTHVFLLLLGLLLRRILLTGFDTELVAYDGLLSNIFSLLAIADLNAGSLFNFHMYQAFARQDQDRVNHLMSLFRGLYRILGGVMVCLCVGIYFLLPAIFGDKVQLWSYFRLMYVIYAVGAVSTYFLGYWQTLLVAGQKEYQIAAAQTACSTTSQIAKAVILLTTRSFLLYLLITGAANLTTQLLIRHRARKEYPQIRFTPVTREDYQKEGFFHQLRDLVVIRLAGTVMYSTDHLLMTLLVNIRASALYSNYCLIGATVNALFVRLIMPLRATLADMIYKEDKVKSYRIFRMTDLISFFLASVLLVCYFVVFQSAITVFFGGQFLLTEGFVLTYALQNYVNMKYQAVAQMRGSFGEYGTEKRCSVIGMLLNLVLSVLLSRYWGAAGIVLGTVIALCSFWHSHIIIVERKFFQHSVIAAWGREALFLLLAMAELGAVWWLTRAIPFTVWGMLLRGVTGVCVTTLINLTVFWRSNSFRELKDRVMRLLTSRLKQGNNKDS